MSANAMHLLEPMNMHAAAVDLEESARLNRHSVTIAGHRTSISLEAAFWGELRRIAGRRGRSLNAIVSEIDAGRSGNLSGAIRVYVLETLKRESPRAEAAE